MRCLLLRSVSIRGTTKMQEKEHLVGLQYDTSLLSSKPNIEYGVFLETSFLIQEDNIRL